MDSATSSSLVSSSKSFKTLRTFIVLVAPRDFLGIFFGKLRYIDWKPSRAIKGPVPGL